MYICAWPEKTFSFVLFFVVASFSHRVFVPEWPPVTDCFFSPSGTPSLIVFCLSLAQPGHPWECLKFQVGEWASAVILP